MQNPTTPTDAKMLLVYLLVYFFLPELGGLASGLLILVRYRKSASLILCLSIIIGYGTAKNAVSSLPHPQLASATIMYGTFLPCFVTLCVMAFKRIISRIIRAITWFWRSLNSDVSIAVDHLREFRKRRPLDQPVPKQAMQLPWRWILCITFFAAFFIIGKSAHKIQLYLRDHAPKTATITNIMDLVSLIFVTPKCFSGPVRDRLQDAFEKIAKSFFSSVANKWSVIGRLSAGAFLFSAIFPAFFLLTLMLEQANTEVENIFNNYILFLKSIGINYGFLTDSLLGWLGVIDTLFKFVGASTLVFAALVIAIVIGVGIRKLDHEQQEKWDTFCFAFGIAIFAYSRTLSIL